MTIITHCYCWFEKLAAYSCSYSSPLFLFVFVFFPTILLCFVSLQDIRNYGSRQQPVLFDPQQFVSLAKASAIHSPKLVRQAAPAINTEHEGYICQDLFPHSSLNNFSSHFLILCRNVLLVVALSRLCCSLAPYIKFWIPLCETIFMN